MKLAWLTGRIEIAGMLAVLLLGGCGGGAGESGNSTSAPQQQQNPAGGAGESGVSVPESSNKARNLAPVAAQTTESSVVNGINTLGLDLLGNTSGNAVVAPYSVSVSLARLLAGAKGSTRTAINGVMHLNGLEAGVDSAFNDLDLGINDRMSASLLDNLSSRTIAAAWAQARYGYLITYMDTLAENYGLKPSRADFAFAQDAASQTLSDWSSQASGGLLANITTSQDTRFVLGDAVQFNAAWAEPFDPALTGTSGFQPLSSNAINVPFMRRTSVIPRISGDGYIALALSLTGGQQFLVVLPDEGRYTEIQAALTAERLKQIAADLTPALVDLALPKFTIENTVALDLGVASAKGAADFSGIDGTMDLYISSTAHHSRLSVTETGFQAGSVTMLALDDLHPESWSAQYGSSFTFGWETIYETPQVSVILGRPFIYAVRDSVTGAILFMGRVMDPSK